MTAPLAATKLPPLDKGEFRFVTNALTGDAPETGPRRFRAVASSTITDLAGNTISLAALEQMAADFREGRTVFMDHNYTDVVDRVFGTTDSAEVVQTPSRDPRTNAPVYDLVVGGIVNEPNPRAVQLHQSIAGGYVKFGASIGAIVTRHKRDTETGGMLIDSLSAKEMSIVGIPKNQRSWALKAAAAAEDLPDENLEDDEPEVELTAAETPEVTPEAVDLALGQAATLLGNSPEVAEAPVIENAVMDAEKRNDLPDSAFACPEKRKYPINDEAHVRAALSRIADPSNDQCGRDKILAAARKMGIGEHETQKSLTDEELVAWAASLCPECGGTAAHPHEGCDSKFHKVPDDDDDSASDVTDGATSADLTPEATTDGQEAPAATPEPASADGQEADEATPVTASGESGLTYEAQDVADLVAHVRTLVASLSDRDETIAALREELAAANARVAEMANEAAQAETLIRNAMTLPLRPKAAAHLASAGERVQRLTSVYGPDIAAAITSLNSQE